MAINGRLYDWESVEIKLPSGTAVGVAEISYNDEKGLEARYGKGAKARGYGRKNYKASGSMTLDRDEFEKLKAALGDNVYGNKPFSIVVSYGTDDQPTVTDTLPDVLITKTDSSNTKQDSENVSQMKLDFTILSPIKWGDKAAA
jgi:hypothetical protein